MFLTELGICCHFWHFHLLDSITGTIYTIDMLDFLPNVEKIASRYDTLVHVCLRHGACLSPPWCRHIRHSADISKLPNAHLRFGPWKNCIKGSTQLCMSLRHGAGISAMVLEHLRHSADISKLPNAHLRYGDLSLRHDLSDVSPKVLHWRACVCAIRLWFTSLLKCSH